MQNEWDFQLGHTGEQNCKCASCRLAVDCVQREMRFNTRREKRMTLLQAVMLRGANGPFVFGQEDLEELRRAAAANV